MVAAYLILLIPVGFSVLVVIRPEMSLDEPTELAVVALILIVLVPLAVSAFVRRTRPLAQSFELVLATMVAAIGVVALGHWRMFLGDEELSLVRLLGSYVGLLVLMLPGALAGSWWGGRGARAAAATLR